MSDSIPGTLPPVPLARQENSSVSFSVAAAKPLPKWKQHLNRLNNSTIIDPRTNSFIAYWDLITTVALVFTALVTPVEVSFLTPPAPSKRWSDSLFLCNRVIDLVFITDMTLQFRIAFASSSAEKGLRWVTNGKQVSSTPQLLHLSSGRPLSHPLASSRLATRYARQVAINYGCSKWFLLDFFSVMTSLFDLVGGEEVKDLKVSSRVQQAHKRASARARAAHTLALAARTHKRTCTDKPRSNRSSSLRSHAPPVRCPKRMPPRVCVVSPAQVLRAVRTLRLIKLVKLARGSRIFKRWEMRLSINYATLQFSGIILIILISCHWFACIWGLQATFDPLNSWLAGKGYCIEWGDANESRAVEMLTDGSCPGAKTSFTKTDWECSIGDCDPDGVCEGGYACVDAVNMYSYSLYFSVMTVTSVGYGDVSATSFNVAEQTVCVVIMLLTGMIWGYLIGIFCTLAAVSPAVQTFRDDLSDLNVFMSIHNVEPAMRFRLREYMHQTVQLKTIELHRTLLTKLSPAMQGEMSLLINERTMNHVWYLRHTPRHETSLLIHLASKLQPMVFPPLELCPAGSLYILQRGAVIHAGRVRQQGGASMVWGEDVLLDEPELQVDFPAVTASYTYVLTIMSMELTMTLNVHPTFEIHSVRRRWRLRRALVRHAEELAFARPPYEFHGRSYPIYAKALARRMRKEAEMRRLEQQAKLSLCTSPAIRASGAAPSGAPGGGHGLGGASFRGATACPAPATCSAGAAGAGGASKSGKLLPPRVPSPGSVSGEEGVGKFASFLNQLRGNQRSESKKRRKKAKKKVTPYGDSPTAHAAAGAWTLHDDACYGEPSLFCPLVCPLASPLALPSLPPWSPCLCLSLLGVSGPRSHCGRLRHAAPRGADEDGEDEDDARCGGRCRRRQRCRARHHADAGDGGARGWPDVAAAKRHADGTSAAPA